MAAFSILGLLFLTCVLGAASLYFDFFPGSLFRDAFVGYQALQERGQDLEESHAAWPGLGITCDKPAQTFDGFTLYTTTQGCKAHLIDMAGRQVHEWSLPFSAAWSHADHLRNAPLADEKIHWFRARAFPNGDLLAVYQSSTDTPPGYGLAKMDKDSRPLWTYSSHAHHDFDVSEDGTIYLLTQRIETERPAGITSIRSPFLADYLVHLSADGKELEKISLLEAFRDSPFRLMAFPAEETHREGTQPSEKPVSNPTNKDVLHSNGVKVLSHELAPKFPRFKPGQVLLSFRNIDTIAVFDPAGRSLVWAARGIWHGQHAPSFLPDGNLLLYDNTGSLQATRVLEFDPNTNGYPWTYTREDSPRFNAVYRGMTQHLPNDNTLIVDPQGGRIFEVTHGRERVWEFGCSGDADSPDPGGFTTLAVTGAFRYSPDQLTFLKGTKYARP